MSDRQTRTSALRRQLRSMEAAAIAGIAFSVLFVIALWLMSRAPDITASPAETERFYRDSGAVRLVLIGLQLVPISVIALLWFIAVIRRRIGDREDKLFSTVFFGGGLLFAALVLVGSAAAAAPAVVAELAGRPPDSGGSLLLRGVAMALLVVHAPRVGSLFIFSASTLGLRTGTFPRWLSLVGYALGASLLVPIPFVDSLRYAFPAWVGVASAVLLTRRRASPPQLLRPSPSDLPDTNSEETPDAEL